MKQAIKNMIPAILSRALQDSSGLPEILAQAEKIALNIVPGAHHQRRSGGGDYFWQYREYNQQDRAQDIDWRQSARHDKLYVRQNEWQTPQSILFWCQNDRGMRFRSSKRLHYKIEEAMIITMALAILADKSNEHIRPLYKSDRFTPPIILRLAQFLYNECEDAMPDISKIKTQKNASFILSGDFLAPIEEFRQSIQQLKHHAPYGVIIQVLDPAELSLPYDGRVIFQNGDGENRQLINHVGSVREDYIKRINAHNNELAAECRKLGIDFVQHISGDDTRKLIMNVQQLLSRPRTAQQVNG